MTDTLYRRALAAEPRLVAIERLVDLLADLVRPSDRLCSGCAWERIVKPMARPWVGYERGVIPEQAPDVRPPARVMTLTELLAAEASRTDATTDTERWLRTSEAWDAVTRPWIDRLHDADPANGCGMGRCP
jgi:hypothetical protein